jgi:hypothetical protein
MNVSRRGSRQILGSWVILKPVELLEAGTNPLQQPIQNYMKRNGNWRLLTIEA